MRHEPIERLRGRAQVVEAAVLTTRRERLRRWAELLGREGPRRLNALMWVEHHVGPARARLRRPGSPIEVAFADPMLRVSGLSGDTLGEAQSFFGLSDDEAHELLCDCHFAGRLTGRGAAWRVRAYAAGGVWRALVRWTLR